MKYAVPSLLYSNSILKDSQYEVCSHTTWNEQVLSTSLSTQLKAAISFTRNETELHSHLYKGWRKLLRWWTAANTVDFLLAKLQYC